MKDLEEEVNKIVHNGRIANHKKVKKLLTLFSVSGSFTEGQMFRAWKDGVEAERQRCGNFDIDNYR